MTNLNQTIIEDTFGQAYNRDKFTHFARELLNGMEYRGTTCSLVQAQFKDYIKSYHRVGKYIYNDGFEKIIDVLEVNLKRTNSVERARAMQRNFVAHYLNGNYGGIKRDAALVAFISEGSSDWRFSFVKMDYKSQIITENGKQKRIIEKELTPAKRFSFLVGENEYIHTAQKQLLDCLNKASSGKQITLEDLVEAFDIEKVSKEFFAEYKKLYIRLRDELQRIYDFDINVHNDFDKHEINIDDFAKKTLGQLVFLYFVQKKGWLGVKPGEQWGSGDKRFLRNLFEKKYVEYDNFFNDILEPLFYRALARDRGNENDNFAPLNCRIPFLNGGLFEPINGYDYAQTDITIDNVVFKEIFDIFDLYNFTVKEDEPLEREVAIDPEMLGKVFENLLPENERKGNGAFYTPREIVHYMCQESLINYLYNTINTTKLSIQTIKQGELFEKRMAKQSDLNFEKFEEIVSKEDISTFIKLGESTYTNSKCGIKEEFPSSIMENATKINQALKDVKICDPAIGSGAFPVGMMNEIVRARLALGVESKSAYQIKREIIENNLYGVDLDDGAVEIAKLRFWLSLIVDEEDISNIKPLPNLDYKVMQGNSLITTYEGIDFDEIVEDYKSKSIQFDLDFGDMETESKNIITSINGFMKKYIKASHDTEKQNIRNKIEQDIINLVKNKIEQKAELGGIELKKAEQTIRDFAQNRKHRNFFPWKLFFADIFMKGGFDIVIANPPYVGEKGHKEIFTPIQESFLGEYYTGKMDLFYFFFHLALNILKSDGISAFITTNYFVTADGAKKLRKDLKKRSSLLTLLNFNEMKIFESALGQHNLITIFKKIYRDSNICNIINVSSKGTLNDSFYNIVSGLNDEANYNKFKQSDLYDGKENYIRLFKKEDDSTLSKILNKIANSNPLLGNIADINSGADITISRITKKHLSNFSGNFEYNSGVFVLSEAEINLINPNNNEKNILKDYIKNSNIFKYGSTLSDDKLIYLKWEDNIELYPNIKKHLLRFIDILKDQVIRYEENYPWWALHRPRIQEIFDSPEKIIVPYRAKSNIFGYYNKPLYSSRDVFYITNIKKSFDLKYILAILNSKLYYVWLYNKGKRKGDTLELYYKPLSEIPIKKIDSDKQKLFANVVNNILELVNSGNYSNDKRLIVKKYEDLLDLMIYKLYDLTYSEVLTVDKDFKLSEKEYNEYKLT